MKAESEKKKSRNPESANNKSVKSLPEINSTFFENSLDAIMIGSQDGHIFAANPASCRMLGYTEKELCNLGRTGIVEQSPQLYEAVRKRKETGNFFGELPHIRKDGTRFPVEISSSVFTNSDGREFTTIIIRDITERKKTEKSLMESEARLRLASQATGFGSYSYDFVTRLTYFSDEFLALYGILPGDTIEHFIDIISRSFHTEDREPFIDAIKKANDPEGSGILDVEFRIIKPDGEVRWLKARGRTIFSGNLKKDKPLHANGIMQDITERKVSENALKQAHDWQETIFEGSSDAIFISDADAILIVVNKAACDLTGYSREELLKMRIPDLHDELDLEAFKKYHKKIFKGEKILSEAKMRRRDGVKVDTEFNNSRISILGKFYMHTTARDITERKKFERELFEFGERYRLLMENSGLAIGYYSLDGKILMLNQQAIINLGGKPGDYIGKNVTEVFGKEAGLIYIDRYKHVAASEKPLKYEDNVILDGRPGWYMSTDTRFLDRNGNVEGIQIIADNITERKIIEERIKNSEAEYRSLFENSIIGISQALPDGKIIRINKAYVDMYGYPDISTMMKEMANDVQKLYSNPEDRKMVLKSLDELGYMPSTEFELNRRNGEKFWALVGAKQVKDNSGKVIYLQAEHIDITSQKKMEKELQQSHELLEKLNQHLVNAIEEERNQIALNLHDDLGQKLTAINLDIAWLKSRIGVQSKNVREKFEEMSDTIKETIESIRETSSLLRPAILFDLGLVPAIKSQLSSFEKQTGIECHFYCEPEEIVLKDRLSLIFYRVLQESLTNIARHSGASATEVNLRILKKNIEMLIEDDGTGIEKDKINSLRSMGIAGMKERVKSVQGKITFKGEPGSGTRIQVIIPFINDKSND